MKKMPLKKVKQISWILLLISFTMILVGAHNDWLSLTLLGLVPWLGSSVVGFLYYRCPHCNQFLGRTGGQFCPFCGKKLED